MQLTSITEARGHIDDAERYIEQALRQIRNAGIDLRGQHPLDAFDTCDLATVDLVRAAHALVLARDVITNDEESDKG
jgi:hypothetical protein